MEILDRSITDQFLICLESYPPDFEGACYLLQHGVDINAELDDNETLLSKLIMGYPDHKTMNHCMLCNAIDCSDCVEEKAEYDSHYLPKIVRFFLSEGYDATKNNGRHGALALDALCWSSYDKYILDAAKFLVAGCADPTVIISDGLNVFDSVDWKLSGCIAGNDDLESECLFSILYDILMNRDTGTAYKDYYWWDIVKGKRIDNVYSCSPPGKKAVFPIEADNNRCENCFTHDIILDCEDIPLVVNASCHAYVNFSHPTASTPVPELDTLIGKRIEDVQFKVYHTKEGQLITHHAALLIILDDGSVLTVYDACIQLDEKYYSCLHLENAR